MLKKSAMDVSSIYQLSPSDVEYCVVQTIGRKKYYLQGELINASLMKYHNSYPKRTRNRRFRMLQSQNRKEYNKSIKSNWW